ncbi:MAG: tryptophan--tRNA ligase [Candidatus Micrarchaeales archaeon]
MSEEKIDVNLKEVLADLLQANEKLVTQFNASRFSSLKSYPNFYGFERGLYYSHRDFDAFMEKLDKGEQSAIVSGLNPSGQLHMGHKVVFDCNLFFQKEYGVPVYIPLSDDESYVSRKVEDRMDAVENSVMLIRSLLAYGFDPDKTKILLDYNYPEIFSIAMELSRKVTYSEVQAIYGYEPSTNIGLGFYPAVQAAHVLFPKIHDKTDNVLVPIGPDEDAHLRLCRDIAARTHNTKAAVLHGVFMPDINGEKMSKSRPDGVIYFKDDPKLVKKKIGRALSGGQKTVEEHRRLGGDPDADVSIFYLEKYFLNSKECEELKGAYRRGELLSGEVKVQFAEKMTELVNTFQKNLRNVKDSDFEKVIMQPESKIKPELKQIWGAQTDVIKGNAQPVKSKTPH